MADGPSGVHLELFERNSTGDAVCVIPRQARINGQEVLLAADSSIDIAPISEKGLVTARLTLILKSLSIHQDQETTGG